MIEASHPVDESSRLAVLHTLNLLDSTPEALSDCVVQAAAAVFDAPISALTLVDMDRQWFKASVGLRLQETSRTTSFCAHVVSQNELLVVSDARDDVRFFDNPLVLGTPGIRFYAGVPIRIDSQTVGALCVIDTLPRECDPQAYARLQSLGIAVESWISVRSRLRAPIGHLLEALKDMARPSSAHPCS